MHFNRLLLVLVCLFGISCTLVADDIACEVPVNDCYLYLLDINMPDELVTSKLQDEAFEDMRVITEKYPQALVNQTTNAKPPFYQSRKPDPYNDNTDIVTTFWVKGKNVKIIEEIRENTSAEYSTEENTTTSTISNLSYKVKDSRRANRDSVVITGELEEISNLLYSESVTINFFGNQWILPLEDLRKKSENIHSKSISVSHNRLAIKQGNCTARFNLKNGSFNIKATGLELDNTSEEDFYTEILFDEKSVISETGITGDVPVSLLRGKVDYLQLDKIRYSKSPYKAAAKRATISGVFTAKDILEISDTSFLKLSLGELSDSIGVNSNNFAQRGNSANFTYDATLEKDLTAYDLIAEHAFDLFISKAYLNFDSGKFKIVADIFYGKNNQETIYAANDNQDLQINLSMKNFDQSVAIASKYSPFNKSKLAIESAEAMADIMLQDNFEDAVNGYFIQNTDNFVYSHWPVAALNSTIGNDDGLYWLWKNIDDKLINMSFHTYKSFTFNTSTLYSADKYTVFADAWSMLTINNLEWDITPEIKNKELEFNITEYELIEKQDSQLEKRLISEQKISQIKQEFGESLVFPVNMVEFDGIFNTLEDDEKQIYELPLNNGNQSLVIIFPKGNSNLDQIEEKLIQFPEWLSQASPQHNIINIPEFNIENIMDDEFGLHTTYQTYIETHKKDSIDIDYSEIGGLTYYETAISLSSEGLSSTITALSESELSALVQRNYYTTHYASNSYFSGIEVSSWPNNNEGGVPVEWIIYHGIIYNTQYPFIYIMIDNNNSSVLLTGRYQTLEKVYSVPIDL